MKKLLLASAAVVVLSGSMFADTVTMTGGSATAFAFGGATPTWISYGTDPGAGAPFWNDASDDTGTGGSHLMNIGYVLTDTGGLTGTPSVLGTDTVSTMYTGAGGADPTAFNFVRNAVSYNVTLLFADSGMNTGANPSGAVGSQIGYYVGSTMTALYNVGPTTSPTGSQTFNPGSAGTAYGFYDTVCYSASAGVCTSSETYMTSGVNTGPYTGTAWNHFALFQLASGSYVIGFTGQNGLFGEHIGDFQDTVIELSLASVPEPGTIAIMGLGLAALGFLGRRRFARK